MPPIGLCGHCSKAFQSSAFAYKCTGCAKNFHPDCLQLGQEYAKDSGVFRVLRDTGCVLCKTCREGRRPATDNDRMAQMSETIQKLSEEKKVLEARVLSTSTAAARMAQEDLQKQLEAAAQRIAQLEAAGQNMTPAAMQHLETVDREMQRLRIENQKLLSEGNKLTEKYAVVNDKYASLKRKVADKQVIDQPMNIDAGPSTAMDPTEPIVITTANVNELIIKRMETYFREIRREIKEEMRINRHRAKTPTTHPDPDASGAQRRDVSTRRTTFAAIAAQQPRRRSVSVRNSGPTPAEASFRISNNKKKQNDQQLKKANPTRTRASVLAAQPIEVGNRFTILTTDDVTTEEEARTLMGTIQADRQLAEVTELVDIQRRSTRSIFVETSTVDGATALKNAIQQRYPATIIKEAAIKRPQLRITGCQNQEHTPASIKDQNPWLTSEINIERTYEAGSRTKKYWNVIISCSLDDQIAAIDNGRMLMGFSACRVHEYNDVIQCRKCWRYGHFRHACSFAEICRICGKGQHTDEACDAPRDTCANCVRHNKTHSNKVSTNHRVTDDRCPVRIDRHENVLDFLARQQPRRGGRNR